MLILKHHILSMTSSTVAPSSHHANANANLAPTSCSVAPYHPHTSSICSPPVADCNSPHGTHQLASHLSTNTASQEAFNYRYCPVHQKAACASGASTAPHTSVTPHASATSHASVTQKGGQKGGWRRKRRSTRRITSASRRRKSLRNRRLRTSNQSSMSLRRKKRTSQAKKTRVKKRTGKRMGGVGFRFKLDACPPGGLMDRHSYETHCNRTYY